MRHKQIVIIGSGDGNKHNEDAYMIGKHIAKNGWVLISGGRGGIMEAASRGAYEEKGIVVGIIPDSRLGGANKFCNIVIPTDMNHARNMVNILSGDIIIAIGGAWGTLSELSYAQIYGRPIILCSFTGGFSEKFPSLLEGNKDKVYEAKTLEDVFKFLNEI